MFLVWHIAYVVPFTDVTITQVNYYYYSSFAGVSFSSLICKQTSFSEGIWVLLALLWVLVSLPTCFAALSSSTCIWILSKYAFPLVGSLSELLSCKDWAHSMNLADPLTCHFLIPWITEKPMWGSWIVVYVCSEWKASEIYIYIYILACSDWR